jgi:hypothetical protein
MRLIGSKQRTTCPAVAPTTWFWNAYKLFHCIVTGVCGERSTLEANEDALIFIANWIIWLETLPSNDV